MTVTVTLKTPITIKGETVNALTFKEADVGDLIAGEVVGKTAGQVGQVAATLASMAGVSYPDFKQIKARDFAAISEATGELLGNATSEMDGAI